MIASALVSIAIMMVSFYYVRHQCFPQCTDARIKMDHEVLGEVNVREGPEERERTTKVGVQGRLEI
jgi:hypothetical protein